MMYALDHWPALLIVLVALTLTYYLQLGQLPDVSGQDLEVVVTQIESAKSGCKTSISLSLHVCNQTRI